MPTIDTTLQPSRSPTHRCRECGAYWMEWPDSWSLCSKECGPCCDNSADFRSKLNALIVSTIFVRAETLDATLAEFDAFKREVSDAVEDYYGEYRKDLMHPLLSRFILPKPVDPLIYLAREMVLSDGVVRTDSQKAAIREGRAANTAADDFYDRLRTALPARGLKLVEVGDAD